MCRLSCLALAKTDGNVSLVCRVLLVGHVLLRVYYGWLLSLTHLRMCLWSVVGGVLHVGSCRVCSLTSVPYFFKICSLKCSIRRAVH